MSWQVRFEGGPFDGRDVELEGPPEPEITVYGAKDEAWPQSCAAFTPLLRPDQWATYRLSFGVLPAPLRYRLVEEKSDPEWIRR